MNLQPTYDAFLSHSSADKPAVEELARKLRDEHQVKVFFDRWDLVPGTQWQEALEKALAGSHTCVVFIGPEGLSPWHNAEMRTALGQRVEENPKRVIPVLLPGAQEGLLPQFLSQRTWVDLRNGLDDEAAIRRLIAGIRGNAPGPETRSRPTLGKKPSTSTPQSAPGFSKANSSKTRRSRLFDWGVLMGILGALLTVLAWLWPREPGPPSSPELHSVRVQVLDPEGAPIEGSTVRASAGNEPHLLPDTWWQIETPAVKVPSDGRVIVWAEHPQWKGGNAVIALGADPNPRVEIRLEAPEEWILGVVTDSSTRGLEGARVTARNHAASATTTNRDGQFELRVNAALNESVRLHVEHPDFAPKDSYCYAGIDGCSVVLN